MSDIAELRLLFGASALLIVAWIVYIRRWHTLLEGKRKRPANRTKRPGRKKRGKPTRKSRKK